MKIVISVVVAVLFFVWVVMPINLSYCERKAPTMKDGERCGIFWIKKAP